MARPVPKTLPIITADQTQGESIIAPEFVGPAMKSDGDQDYLCGSCGAILLDSITPDDTLEVVIKCGKCHALNVANIKHA